MGLDLRDMDDGRRQKSCSFWLEIPEEIKQNEQEHFSGYEPHFQCTISQDVSVYNFSYMSQNIHVKMLTHSLSLWDELVKHSFIIV
jgi:hypothetical protein